MATDNQYRTTARANLRDEPNVNAYRRATLEPGVILHVDPERQPEGDWLPVLLVRAWIHRSNIEPV